MSKKQSKEERKKMSKAETALVKIDSSNYPVLSMNAESFGKIIERNVGSENLNPFSFQRIKIPSGGGTQFEIPDFDDVRHVSNFRCVLLYKKRRADKCFWSKPYGSTDSDSRPDCTSKDGITGFGSPGGHCATCPLNEWGSGVSAQGNPTKGKRCRDSLLIFPAFENDLMPMRFALPPTSIGNFNKFGLQLASYCKNDIQGLQYFEVVTEVSLEVIDKPVKYSRATFKVARDENNQPMIFDAAQRAHLEQLIYGDEKNVGLQASFESAAADQSDFENEN